MLYYCMRLAINGRLILIGIRLSESLLYPSRTAMLVDSTTRIAGGHCPC